MIPYTCTHCGGATKRCGRGGIHEGIHCNGSQVCWEDDCVITVMRVLWSLPERSLPDAKLLSIGSLRGLSAVYDGHGRYEVADHPNCFFTWPSYFKEHPEDCKLAGIEYVVGALATCRTCW